MKGTITLHPDDNKPEVKVLNVINSPDYDTIEEVFFDIIKEHRDYALKNIGKEVEFTPVPSMTFSTENQRFEEITRAHINGVEGQQVMDLFYREEFTS